MPKLSDDLANARPAPAAVCGVKAFLANYEQVEGKAEAAKVAAILMDTSRASTALSDTLRANGYQVSNFMIRRHRTGQCSCR